MKIVSRSVNETLKIGRIIAKGLCQGDIVCLFGELGSGKTILTKGIAEGLGIRKNKIISPTFVLIREHKAQLPFYHFDLYRLKHLLPRECLKIEITIKGARKRQFEFIPIGERYKDLVRSLEK